MADYTLRAGSYGHFGHSTYNDGTVTWNFETLTPQRQLKARIVATLAQIARGSGQKKPSYITQETRLGSYKATIDLYPELRGFTFDIQVDSLVSWAVSTTHHGTASGVGQVLATTCLHCSASSRTRSAVVFYAHPAADDGNVLYIACAAQESSLGFPIRWPFQSPIRQIVASQHLSTKSCQHTQYLAVRFDTKLVIISISLPQHDQVSKHSAVSCQVVMEMQSGNHAEHHADVSFNPWLPDQFAAIDVSGIWAIFNTINHRSIVSQHGHSNLLPIVCGAVSDEFAAVPDRWARVLWLTSSRVIMFCLRTKLCFLHIPAKLMVDFQNPFTKSTALDHYLDIKRVGHNHNLVLVLTTSHILLIQLHVTEDFTCKQFTLEPSLVASIQHYHDTLDSSLSIAAFQCGNNLSALLYSKLSSHFSYFSFNCSEDGYEVSLPVQIEISNRPDAPFNEVIALPFFPNAIIQDDQHIFSIQGLAISQNSAVYFIDLQIDQEHLPSDAIPRCFTSSRNFTARQTPISAISVTFCERNIKSQGPWLRPNDRFLTSKLRINSQTWIRPTFNMHDVYQHLTSSIYIVSQPSTSQAPDHSLHLAQTSHLTIVDDPSRTMLELFPPCQVESFKDTINGWGKLKTYTSIQADNRSRTAFLSRIIPSVSFVDYTKASQDLKTLFSQSRNSGHASLNKRFLNSVSTEVQAAALNCGQRLSHSMNQLQLPIHAPKTKLKGKEPQATVASNPTQDVPSWSAKDNFSGQVLLKYCKFSQDVPKAETSTRRAINHWVVGSDPANYDFVKQSTQDDRDRDTQHMSAAQREKYQKSQQRRTQRLEQESLRLVQMTQTQDSLTGAQATNQPVNSQSLLKQALYSQRAMTPSHNTMVTGLVPSQDITKSGKKKKRTKGF